MATIKPKFISKYENTFSYPLKQKEKIASYQNVNSLEEVHDFYNTALYGIRSNENQAVHIIQSWSPEESAKYSPEFFHKIGKEVISKAFPNHIAQIVTHYGTDHIHNHIAVIPWDLNFDKKIHNKMHHRSDLMKINDEICKAKGLSVITEDTSKKKEIKKEGEFKASFYRQDSWREDLKQKIKFATEYSGDFDHFSKILDDFNIQVKVQNKNISYKYPDKERFVRGKKLGEIYDKEFLSERFQDHLGNSKSHRSDVRFKILKEVQAGQTKKDKSKKYKKSNYKEKDIHYSKTANDSPYSKSNLRKLSALKRKIFHVGPNIGNRPRLYKSFDDLEKSNRNKNFILMEGIDKEKMANLLSDEELNKVDIAFKDKSLEKALSNHKINFRLNNSKFIKF
jgi:hypothetical protein